MEPKPPEGAEPKLGSLGAQGPGTSEEEAKKKDESLQEATPR